MSDDVDVIIFQLEFQTTGFVGGDREMRAEIFESLR